MVLFIHQSKLLLSLASVVVVGNDGYIIIINFFKFIIIMMNDEYTRTNSSYPADLDGSGNGLSANHSRS